MFTIETFKFIVLTLYRIWSVFWVYGQNQRALF